MINFVDVMLSAILVSNSLIRGREREKRERYNMWKFSDFCSGGSSKCFDYRSKSMLLVTCISCVLIIIDWRGGGRKMRRERDSQTINYVMLLEVAKKKKTKITEMGIHCMILIRYNINLSSYNIIFQITKEYLSFTRMSNLNCSNLHQNLAYCHGYKF